MANQLQSISLSSSQAKSPHNQSWVNTPAWTHFWKWRCAEECLQMPVASKAPHWQPVRSTKKMASMALRGGVAGL